MKQVSQASHKGQPAQPNYIRTAKNKKIGVWLILSPLIVIIGILILYSITSLFSSIYFESEVTDPELNFSFAKMVQAFLSFIGILSAILSIFLIPLGIIYLLKRELSPDIKHDPRSGKNSGYLIPPEIDRWNWGAFGLPIIWGLYHNIWLALIALLPFGNIIMMIVFGIQGNEFAWKAQRWDSVETFLAKQKKWKPWGIGFFILSTLFSLWRIVSFF